MQKTLLQLPGAQSQDYTEQVGDILALLGGSYRSADGAEAHIVPGEDADVQVCRDSGAFGAAWLAARSRGLDAAPTDPPLEVSAAPLPAIARLFVGVGEWSAPVVRAQPVAVPDPGPLLQLGVRSPEAG